MLNGGSQLINILDKPIMAEHISSANTKMEGVMKNAD
jgi:hypothetical protein